MMISMSIFQAVVMGVVQGLGEFLPISSSGHLVLVPWLFNWQDPGLSFDVALHFGTLIAVVAFFWKDWLKIFSLALQSIRKKENSQQAAIYDRNLLWYIVIASVPGAVAGLLLEKYADTVFRHPLLVASTLALVGLLLFIADKRAREIKDLKKVSAKDAVIIGAAQAVAIIPGVSRSGATILTALHLGLDRSSAARFSFLISTPIIFGATIIKLKSFFSSGLGSVEIVGILAAAISGYLAIAWMIKFIEKVSYKVFFWYRLALALVVLAVWLAR